MQSVTESAACLGVDMTPIGPTDVQRSKDAAMLIRVYCQVCPVPEKVNCHDMRLGASGVWGGRYFPPRKGQIT